MIPVTLFSRKDCHLCDEARAHLDVLQAEYPHELTIVDVDNDLELKRTYGELVPVVQVGPYRLKAPFTQQELAVTLGAAMDRQTQIDQLNNPNLNAVPSNQSWNKSDGFSYWLSRHYLAILNILVIIYLGLPILSPVLMKVGAVGPASLIYRGYGLVCHQLAFRSFFLFGEQPVYPREAAGIDRWKSLREVTSLSEGSQAEDLLKARTYVGDENVGYKIALCQRDVAIYGSILLFGILFAVTGRIIKPLPWYLWVMIGLVPIGLDGLSQLMSQPPLSFWPMRESTPLLRTLTGFLFGFTTAWFGYPMVEQAMAETRKLLSGKRARTLHMTPVEDDKIKQPGD
jgi:uncharacterized membrane protein